MPEWIYRNTDAREYNQRDTFHFSAGKILLHTKINILLLWKNFSRASSYICLKHFVDKNFNQLSHSLKWLNKGSLHTSIFYRKSYTTPKHNTFHSYTCQSCQFPQIITILKKKKKKSSENITSTILWGGYSVRCMPLGWPLRTQSETHTSQHNSSLSHLKVMHTESQLLDQHARQLLNQGSLWRQQG